MGVFPSIETNNLNIQDNPDPEKLCVQSIKD
jgi:hypothetical protein